MLCLPAVEAAAESKLLAVADASALALEAALLNSDSAVSRLTAALIADPWFCRWASQLCPDARNIREVAQQLTSELPQRLSRLASHGDGWKRPAVSEAQLLGAQAESILDQTQAINLNGTTAAESINYFTAMGKASPDESSTLVVSDYLDETPGIEWRLPLLIQLHSASEVSGEALQQAKLDAMKELAYGASHEINNPLANISGRAQALLRDEEDPRRRKLLLAIDNQAMRAHEMISDLMLFARPPALEKELLRLSELVAQAIAELDEFARDRQVELKVGATIDAEVSADATQLLIALKALIENSIEAIGQAGTVTIELEATGHHAVIRVVDTGPGIAEEVQRHMFDPFFSGREAGRGLGFGLSKCWRIIGLHDGMVELESTSATGSTFVVRLPLAKAEP